MRVKRPGDKSELILERGLFTEGRLKDAHRHLMNRVFDDDDRTDDAYWWTTSYFDSDKRCVASIEARVLPFIIDAQNVGLTGLRRLAVDPAWRGHGLARDLIELALTWAQAQSSDVTILFTATPSLYTNFGFLPLPQFAFVGPAAEPLPSEPSRELDCVRDRDLLASLVANRTPVSSQVALTAAPDLVLKNILAAEDTRIAYAKSLDAIILYEVSDDELTLIDVIAEDIPPIGAILGALGLRPRRLKTLFPTDRIGWVGHPQHEDNGLMSRGPLPPGMSRPFMLPPTAEF